MLAYCPPTTVTWTGRSYAATGARGYTAMAITLRGSFLYRRFTGTARTHILYATPPYATIAKTVRFALPALPLPAYAIPLPFHLPRRHTPTACPFHIVPLQVLQRDVPHRMGFLVDLTQFNFPWDGWLLIYC